MTRANPTKEGKYKDKYKTFSEKQLREFQEVQTWLRTVSEKSGKQYLEWRKKNGEQITEDSPLFVGRTKRGVKPITSLRFNQTIKRAAKKAGLNGDNKYGVMRTHGVTSSPH